MEPVAAASRPANVRGAFRFPESNGGLENRRASQYTADSDVGGR